MSRQKKNESREEFLLRQAKYTRQAYIRKTKHAQPDANKKCNHCGYKAADGGVVDGVVCPGYGLCHCGCGKPTRIAVEGLGYGRPRKYLNNHHVLGKPRGKIQKKPPLTPAQIQDILSGNKANKTNKKG